MRTATTKTSTSTKTAPIRTKLSAKAKRPVKVEATKGKKVAEATLASKDAARSIGTTEAPKGTVPLKKLCADIGINPKVARRELRKVRREAIAEKETNSLRKHDLHTRWFLSGDVLKEARKVLEDYVERNGESEA